MAENPFRILLDFRELNFKFYKFVWMSISPREMVNIKDLKDAILNKFSFERSDLVLFLRDGLLPEDENISNILRENDNIRLFYTEPCVNQNASRTFNYEEVGESSTGDQIKSSKKRKEHSNISEDNNEQIESNKKRKHSFSNGTYSFKNNTPENSAFISAVSDDLENVASTDLPTFENSERLKSCEIKKKLKYSHDVSQNSLVSENAIDLTSDIIPMSEKNQSKINSCKKKKKHKHSKDSASVDLPTFENSKCLKSCEIKKKLKYSHGVSQNNFVSENAIVLTSDIIPISEKNQSKINSCKKKKKHKYSKDVSENEIIFHDNIIRMSEINKSKPKSHKNKHSHDASKMASVSLSAVSFHDETIGSVEKLNDFEAKNETSQLRESIFETVINDSKALGAPVSFCASSIRSSSGIGLSLKTSQESNQKISPEQNCSNSSVSDGKPVPKTDQNNISLSQGNNCKKKKRKRHRKRKSLLISPQLVDVSNDSNMDMTLPQKNENLDSLFTSASYQTPEISLRNKETSNNSKSNLFFSNKNADCSKTKSCFVEPFGSYLPSTSTPFSQPHAASSTSPRKNDISEIPSNSNASEDQSCSVTTSQNTVWPALEKITNEKIFSTPSSPCSVTKSKENGTVLNRNCHQENLSNNIINSDKSTDASSNIGIKSRFLDPSFSFKGCPPLNSCPLVGTRIAYKILELDASYSPVVSGYKVGIVKAVNSITDELEIELVEPEVKEGRIGKFENIYEDEFPTCEVIRKVTVSWTSLIDPVQVIY